ncbi:MAG: GGDEF domain-containing protein [Gammaproteobacteria bacterium]|nr:GGDEF domain-containing protein [Gammaproteobacteria bacterium]
MLTLQLDIVTMMTLLASGHLILALMLSWHRVEPSLRATVRIWQAAQLLKAIGGAGVVFGVVSENVPVRLLGNLLIFTGFACELMAYRRYVLHRTLPRLPFGLLIIGSALVLAGIWVPEAWRTQYTVAAASTLLAAFTLLSCLILNAHRRRQSNPLPMLKVLVWTNGLNSLATFSRAISAVLIEQHHVATQAPLNEAAFLLNYLLILINGMGFLLLIKEEVDTKLRELVVRDPLTGLFNRRHLDSSLEVAIEEHNMAQQPLSLCLLDLDHFKAVNDTYGHNAGDYILREFARHLSQHLRPADLVARIGGEEFVVVMHETDAVTASTRIQDILDNFSARQFRLGKDRVKLSFSAGIAERRNPVRPSELIRQADRALYRSKENGRKQVSQYAANSESERDRAAHYPLAE